MDNQNDERGKTKLCSVCKADLPLSDFHKQSKSPDGHQSRWKKCAIKLTREWQQMWPNRVNEKNRNWKHDNLDLVHERNKKYNDEHVEERTKYQTAYRRSLPME